MTSDYRPIDCDQHSILELLAMRRTAVTVRASDDSGGELLLDGVVADVLTHGGAEYLVLREADGGLHRVRLDRLVALYDADGAPVWRQKNNPE